MAPEHTKIHGFSGFSTFAQCVLLAPKKGSIVATKQKFPTNSYQWDVASQFCVFCLPQISDITFQWQKTCPKVLPGKLTHRFMENTHLSWQIPSKMVDVPAGYISKRVFYTFTANITFFGGQKMQILVFFESTGWLKIHPRCGVEQVHFAMLLLYCFRY